MKRKTIVLLSSVMAGALLVGGVFAVNYAVTDNALPLGANLTMGDLDTDDTTYVTLNWGGSTALNDVAKIKVGDNRKVGVVSLKASENYVGVFELKLEDRSSGKTATTPYLLDYLNVYIYRGALDLTDQGALPDGTVALSIPKGTTKDAGEVVKITKTLEATGTPAGAEYTIFVNLDDSANPVFSSIENDVVYLQADWNPKPGQEATGSLVYVKKPGDWTNIYAYAWDGAKNNGEWPGVKMEYAYDDVYSILVPSDCQAHIIFNNGAEGDANVKLRPEDLDFTGYNANSAPYWDNTAGEWAAKPNPTISEVISATVNGEPITLNDVKEPGSTNRAEYRIDLKLGATADKNDKIKFKSGDTDIYFYHWVPEPTQEDPNAGHEEKDTTEYTAQVAGVHTFYYNSDGHMYVSQPSATVEDGYYLVGSFNEWTASAAYKLTVDSQDANHYVLSSIEFEEAVQLKVKDQGTNWYGDASTWPNCHFTLVDGNVALAAGTYKIDFYVNSEESNHIVPTPLLG